MTNEPINPIPQIQSAIDLLRHIKQMTLDIEIETRLDNPLGNVHEAFEIAMRELLPDDFPLDVLDAARALILLCTDSI